MPLFLFIIEEQHTTQVLASVGTWIGFGGQSWTLVGLRSQPQNPQVPVERASAQTVTRQPWLVFQQLDLHSFRTQRLRDEYHDTRQRASRTWVPARKKRLTTPSRTGTLKWMRD
jgi:hypothetical protein